jgi:hypothetical protein
MVQATHFTTNILRKNMRGYSDVWVGGFPLLHFFTFSAVFPHFLPYLVDFIEDLIDMGSIFAVLAIHFIF